MSCTSGSGNRVPVKSDGRQVLTKMQVESVTSANSTIKHGDLVVFHIDSLFKEGEVIRAANGIRYKVIEKTNIK